MTPAVLNTDIKSLPLLSRGKVRDIYAVGDDKLLVIATDRISAFDVILNNPIPEKGRVLTELTEFWLQRFADLIPNHSTDVRPEDVVTDAECDQVKGRAVVVKRLKPILVEAVARGYLIGSGWKEYQASGSVCGIQLPEGLQLAQQLPEAIFTPAAKAEVGNHDENVSFEHVQQLVGNDLAKQIRSTTISLYTQAAEYARSKGIIIADTKFEFGFDDNGTLHLMDEVLTPDSSRFWPADSYQVGTSPASFDKQFVRDWLEAQPWDKTAPAPDLPEDVINKTSQKYQQALQILTS